jgi:cellobiose-specific phosphotransferase system component IIA
MSSGAYLEVLEEKLAVLNRICGNIEVDRSSVEECIRAVALNSEAFKTLIEIETRLEDMIGEETEEVREVLKEARHALVTAHEGTALLLESIKHEKEAAAKNLMEFSRVDAVRNSYVKVGQRPVFVDKDFR